MKWTGEKIEGYELLKSGRSFVGPRPFKRAKDIEIQGKDEKKQVLKNINKNCYVPVSLIPKDFDMSCFEGHDQKKPDKKSDK